MDASGASVLSAERPFPGLRPYAAADCKYFCGRSTQIFGLYRLLDMSRFVAVVGSSGSGKSSLVRAGLFPLLDEETAEAAGRNWRQAEMRPGGAPIDRLAEALARLAGPRPKDDQYLATMLKERIAFRLRGSSHGVADALSEIEGIEGTSLVLLVDQFEELFRFSSNQLDRPEAVPEDSRAPDEARDFVQLLLESSRTTALDIHVLITMRSDFIGDCARFIGLPEAVSAAQFLVPSLSRDQREEVIRKPIMLAGASIDTVLVEQLLNDAPDNLDQLPVLQHCMLRIWDAAGKATADRKVPRHLTIDHYRAIGGMSGALSRHADEILKSLPGLELAVEQAFRALAEIDKEGRIIRRARLFGELVAETGMPREDLQKVVDRFRADDCSFLTPSLSEEGTLRDETRIDVGHEALLRCWERIGGSSRAGRGARGWLRAEEEDGRRYRGLLWMAESKAGLIGSDSIQERWRWWNERPRTAAWTERYGGGRPQVERLFSESLANLEAEKEREKAERLARQRQLEIEAQAAQDRELAALRNARLMRNASIIVLCLLVVVSGFGILFLHERNTARSESETAEKSLIIAAHLAADIMSRASKLAEAGKISIQVTKELLATAQKTVNQLAEQKQTKAVKDARTIAHIAISDLSLQIQDFVQARDQATSAKEIAEQLVSRYPHEIKFKSLYYAASFRIGDAASHLSEFAVALRQYNDALKVIASLPATDQKLLELRKRAFILNKIGDIYVVQRNSEEAFKQYTAALAIGQDLARNHPGDAGIRRSYANALIRVGDWLADDGQLDKALEKYEVALPIRKALAEEFADDDSIISNLTSIYNRIGDILAQKKKFDEAIKYYQMALAKRKEIAEKDTDNVAAQSSLAFEYMFIGKMYMDAADSDHDAADLDHAADNFRTAAKIRKDLVDRNPSKANLMRYLAESHSRLGKVFAAQNKVQLALDEHHVALPLREKVADQHGASAARQRELIEEYWAIGELLARQGNTHAAMIDFQNALNAADGFLARNGANKRISKLRQAVLERISELKLSSLQSP